VYDHVYKSARMTKADAVPTADVLRRLDSRWKVAVVGDGAMHPAELLEPYGGIDPRVTTPTPGVVWLQRIAGHFERTAWINPEEPTMWDRWQTTRLVRRLFPMFPLSVDGLSDAMRALVGARA
jgi:uncharacterized protein with von Willebrand factor type A (vWA) domain